MPSFEDDLRTSWQNMREGFEHQLIQASFMIEAAEVHQAGLAMLREHGAITEDSLTIEHARLEEAKEQIAELQATIAGWVEEGDRIFLQ